MLEVCCLSFQYEDLPILREVSFAVKVGQLLHIHGTNGSGKTTLLRLIAGLLSPCAGDIRYQGQSILAKESTYGESICYLGHLLGIHPLLTVRENCQVDRHYHPDFDEKIALHALGLVDFEAIPCAHLSTGQQRRVSLMRLFMTKAPIWILDEPFIGLDTLGIKQLKGLFAQHLEQNGILIITSHQPLPLRTCNEVHYFINKADAQEI